MKNTIALILYIPDFFHTEREYDKSYMINHVVLNFFCEKYSYRLCK